MALTLTIWRNCLKRYPLMSSCSPLVNVLLNPLIPDSMSLGRIFPWINVHLFQLRNLVHPITRKLHSFDALREKFDLPPHFFHFYLQVRHFFHSKSPSLTLDKPTTFEHLCAQGPNQLHLISCIYRILHEPTPITETLHHYMCKWSQLVGRPVTIQMWDRIWSSTFKSSKCVTQRETTIKILMFWYRTP
ncbi:hypothetical protein AB205_0076050, partial [Aquarana catesbeiana]